MKDQIQVHLKKTVGPLHQTEFTRRIPTFLTQKQRDRDAKIVKKIVVAWDVEQDIDKTLDLFFKNARYLSNPAYWEVLRTVWVAAGSTDLAEKFRPYFESTRTCRSWFMTPEDAAALDKMEFPLTVWRAYDREPDPGISWTIDRDWCEAYAKVHNRKMKERKVNRCDVFAYVTRRSESEIIIL